MEKSSFFNAEIINGEYDRTYLAEDYANYFSSFIGNGVFPNPSNNLKVVANGDSMKITVKQGKAWINGYYYENDDDLILNLSPADGVLNRIDRVVIRFDLLEREISIKVKQGSFSSNPVAADLERNIEVYELAIADIKIQNGVISINNSNITDLRLNSELCGLVHGAVEQVDTTELFNSYQHYLNEKINSNEFNEWFISLKDRLNPNEDVAVQLQVQITELAEKLKDTVNADMVDGKHASGTLATNEKDNLVIAINEVFTSASDGKTAIANAITGKGETATNTMTFSQLASKISAIQTVKTATGTSQLGVIGNPEVTYSSGRKNRTINFNAFPFKPDVLVIYRADFTTVPQTIYINCLGIKCSIGYYGYETHTNAPTDYSYRTSTSDEFMYIASSSMADSKLMNWIAIKI